MGGRAWGRLLPWILVVLPVAGMGLSSCGSDNGESESTAAKKEVVWAVANESPQTFIERLAKLIETSKSKKDCAQLEEIYDRSVSRLACPADKKLRDSMSSFKVIGVEEHGTGAIIDYKSGETAKGGAIVLFVSPDRRWGISRFGVITKPSIDTSDEDSRAQYDKVVDSYLASVRDRDCDTFFKVALTTPDKKEACKDLFPETADLGKRLKANPSAKPKYEGGNDTYGFYTLETARPVPAENTTISVVRASAGDKDTYVVLDAAPSPTLADQRRVRKELRQQQAERDSGDMTPSSKPSDPAVTTP